MVRYLKHYGVKGMKWGVRKDSYYTPKNRKLSNNLKKKRTINGIFSKLFERESPKERDDRIFKSDILSLNDIPLKNRQYTDDEDMDLINPERATTLKSSNNCMLCTAAYDMRKRGYDITANFTEIGISYGKFLSFYKNGESFYKMGYELIDKDFISSLYSNRIYGDKKNSYEIAVTANKHVIKAFKKEMLSYGEGARGDFSTTFLGGMGHSTVFEITKDDVIIRDCQNNNKYSFDNYINMFVSDDPENYEYRTMLDIAQSSIVRTDNLEPSEEILRALRRR